MSVSERSTKLHESVSDEQSSVKNRIFIYVSMRTQACPCMQKDNIQSFYKHTFMQLRASLIRTYAFSRTFYKTSLQYMY